MPDPAAIARDRTVYRREAASPGPDGRLRDIFMSGKRLENLDGIAGGAGCAISCSALAKSWACSDGTPDGGRDHPRSENTAGSVCRLTFHPIPCLAGPVTCLQGVRHGRVDFRPGRNRAGTPSRLDDVEKGDGPKGLGPSRHAQRARIRTSCQKPQIPALARTRADITTAKPREMRPSCARTPSAPLARKLATAPRARRAPPNRHSFQIGNRTAFPIGNRRGVIPLDQQS